jgi:hypothetical protein
VVLSFHQNPQTEPTNLIAIDARPQSEFPKWRIVKSAKQSAHDRSAHRALSEPDRLEVASDQAIAECGDDAWQAVKALLVANELRSPVALMVMQIRLSALHGFSADTP